MEDPVAEIPRVIALLTQSPPTVQHLAIQRYFLAHASFTHPFCRTGSFALPPATYGRRANSRWLIGCVYRWYKIMSPRIELDVKDVAWNPDSLTLYVSIRQTFRLWTVPFHAADVRLVTVLRLARGFSSDAAGWTHRNDRARSKYFIAAQEDLYQTSEWVKFVSVFRVLWLVVLVAQVLATAACVLAQALGAPVSWWEERRALRGVKGEGEGDRTE